MTVDEVSQLDNQHAILFVRVFRLVLDRKYPFMRHPNIAFSADGETYEHRTCKVGTIVEISTGQADISERETGSLHVGADQEIEKMYGKK